MANLTDIKDLIAQGEGQRLEFKAAFGEETLEAICAFANAEGGTILIGVSDDGEALGVQVGKKTLEDWAHQVNIALDPRIKVDMKLASLVLINTRSIVQIIVPQSQSSAVSCKGKFLRRVGKTNQKMTGEDIAQKLMAVTKLSWDNGFEEAASLADVDLEAFQIFVDLLNKHNRRPVPVDIDIESLLIKLGLSENGKLTRAAVLLLGNNPQKFYPSALVKLGKFRSRTQIDDEREVTGCLIKQMEESMGWFRARLTTKLEITGAADRTTVWEYPLQAVREALANAICHRDYRLKGNIQVRLYDASVEFWNPGSLPSALSVDDLLKDHESIQRNTKVAECLYNAGFIEKWGTGTVRMDELLRGSGHPSPEFQSDSATKFRVRFRSSFTTEYLEEIGLNQRQITILTESGIDAKITNQIYCSKFDVNKRTASRELRELLEKGLLKRHGLTGKGTYYTRS